MSDMSAKSERQQERDHERDLLILEQIGNFMTAAVSRLDSNVYLGTTNIDIYDKVAKAMYMALHEAHIPASEPKNAK